MIQLTAPSHIAETRPRRAHPGAGTLARSQVVLEPLVDPSRADAEPRGYLLSTSAPTETADPDRVRWTLGAVDVLAPSAFLVAPVTAAALGDLLGGDGGQDLGGRFLPALEAARTGRRLSETLAMVGAAHEAGLRVAVYGHRLACSDGFDAVLLDRRTSAPGLNLGSCRLVMARNVGSAEDRDWAVGLGVQLMAGPAAASPIRVAPVDVNRLRGRRPAPAEAPAAQVR